MGDELEPTWVDYTFKTFYCLRKGSENEEIAVRRCGVKRAFFFFFFKRWEIVVDFLKIYEPIISVQSLSHV